MATRVTPPARREPRHGQVWVTADVRQTEMPKANTNYLRAMLNRIFDDGGRFAPRGIVRGTTENDWTTAKAILKKWEQLGYLKIVADPEPIEDEDVCIELLTHIPNTEEIKA